MHVANSDLLSEIPAFFLWQLCSTILIHPVTNALIIIINTPFTFSFSALVKYEYFSLFSLDINQWWAGSSF